MNKRGEERNYGVLIAAIVGIVAIVGLIILFNKGGVSGKAVDASDFAGVDQAVQQSMSAGTRCGQCSAQLDQTGQWNSKKCPYGADQETVSGYTADSAAQYCCIGECNKIGWKRCVDTCLQNAGVAFGYKPSGNELQ